MWRRMCTLACALAALVGCGDDGGRDDGSVTDGALDASEDGGGAPGPAVIPWFDEGAPPLRLAPCPDGWRETVVDGVSECDPYPTEGPEACAEGEAHFPGELGCRPIGQPCPAGDYAAMLPSGGVVYVNGAAAPGGDGSMASPFSSLTEVDWLSLPAGTTVSVAKGTYPGTLFPRMGVRVVGACVRDTRLVGEAGTGRAIVVPIDGVGEARLENLTLENAPDIGLGAGLGRHVTLEGVLIRSAVRAGALVDGAGTVATFRDVVIQETLPAVGGTGGRGVVVQNGATVDATRLIVDGSHDIGVSAAGVGSQLTLSDAVIRNTEPQVSDSAHGRGLELQLGAHADATRILIASNRDVGIIADGADTRLTLADSVVRDTLPQESDSSAGRGITAQSGAVVVASRVSLSDNHDIGLFVAVASAMLSDVVIRDTDVEANTGTGGRGVVAQDGSELTATGLVVTRNHDIGIFAADDATSLTLTDVVVRDTGAQTSDGLGGRGIHAQLGARVTGERIVVHDSLEFGLIAVRNSSIDLSDVSVARISSASCAGSTCPELAFGHGVNAVAAELRLTRFEVRQAAVCGAFIVSLPQPAAPVSVDFTTGVVSMTEIGVCLQDDGYDVARLQSGVVYRDNGINLDATMLPVPMPL